MKKPDPAGDGALWPVSRCKSRLLSQNTSHPRFPSKRQHEPREATETKATRSLKWISQNRRTAVASERNLRSCGALFVRSKVKDVSIRGTLFEERPQIKYYTSYKRTNSLFQFLFSFPFFPTPLWKLAINEVCSQISRFANH